MKEEVKRLHEELLSDHILQGELREALENGSPEEIARAANALGFQIDAGDLVSPDLEEVNDDELEAVSGGVEAKNGHEVFCKWGLLWYADWAEADYKCCPKGEKREDYKHYVLENGLSNGAKSYKCVRCGYVFVGEEINTTSRLGAYYP